MAHPLKILYGVQATGNGHIKRARAIVPELRAAGADVTCLFSGRARDKLFDMDVFGDFSVRDGFTFVVNHGRVDMLRTVFNASAKSFFEDVYTLNLDPYDLVITDFEPVTAWAARHNGKPSIGIGNQYAYRYDVPKVAMDLGTRTFMTKFAPADVSLGLHWHHFNQPVLPPIVDAMEKRDPVAGKILVYMEHEDPHAVIDMIKPITDHRFFVYSSQVMQEADLGHISLRKPSRDGFRRDLADASGVITNAGFELPTETLQLGKKLLVKALDGQAEQMSNVAALRQLNLGGTMDRLYSGAVVAWLKHPGYSRVTYPDTAAAIADWIVNSNREDIMPLAHKLWSHTVFAR